MTQVVDRGKVRWMLVGYGGLLLCSNGETKRRDCRNPGAFLRANLPKQMCEIVSLGSRVAVDELPLATIETFKMAIK